MDLLRAKDLLKDFVNKNFTAPPDLKLFMQLCELVLIEYRVSSKLPEYLIDQTRNHGMNVSNNRNFSMDTDDSVSPKPSSSDRSRKRALSSNRSNLSDYDDEDDSTSNSTARANKSSRLSCSATSSSTAPAKSFSISCALPSAASPHLLTPKTSALPFKSFITTQSAAKSASSPAPTKTAAAAPASTTTQPDLNSTTINITLVKNEPEVPTNQEDLNNTANNQQNEAAAAADAASDSKSEWITIIKEHAKIIQQEIDGGLKGVNAFVIMNDAWNMICVLTSQTTTQSAENCHAFIEECNGLNLIQRQVNVLNRRLYAAIYIDILRILGNLTDIKELCVHLFTSDFIRLFRELLADENHVISILSARCLVNIISSVQWLNNAEVTRDHDYQIIEDNIEEAIRKWDVNNDFDVTTNLCMDSIMALLDSGIEVCLEYACWILVNLNLHNSKSFPINDEIKFKDSLNRISKNQNLGPNVKDSARTIMNIISPLKSTPSRRGAKKVVTN